MTRSRAHRRRHSHPNPPPPPSSDISQSSDLPPSSDSPRPKNDAPKPQLTPYMAARTRELKEEGNRRFQMKDYTGALDVYQFALSLVPNRHPERAVLHTNRAACLMQVKPPRHQDAVHECSLALHAHPGFPRALLRRARAYEALSKLDLALSDLQQLLRQDPSHADAMEMDARIRLALNQAQQREQPDHLMVGKSPAKDVAEQDPMHRAAVKSVSFSPSASDAAAATATNPASHHVVQRSNTSAPAIDEPQYEAPTVAVIAEQSDHATTRDPPTIISIEQSDSPTRTLVSAPEPSGNPIPSAFRSRELSLEDVSTAFADENGVVFTPCSSSREIQTPTLPDLPRSHQNIGVSLNQGSPPSTASVQPEPSKPESSEKVIQQDKVHVLPSETCPTPQLRPLKLVYDHDIRLAEMPVDCTFGELRKLVKEKFPSSKSLLIKYKDIEGDLVTITSTKELRLAESAAAFEATGKSLRMEMPSGEVASMSGMQNGNPAIGLPVVPSVLDQLRLHLVEVPPEQEPYDKDDASLMETKGSVENVEQQEIPHQEPMEHREEKSSQKEGEEYEKWLTEFANLFCTHLGIDPKAKADLREWDMEHCAGVLEEMVTTQDAHKVFETAIEKFRDVVASGLLNWGNVYMCTARKQPPFGSDEDDTMDFCGRLQEDFDWAQNQYALADEKFEQCLRVKPDFCDALLGLAQKDFECAKLHWSLAVAIQTDLRTWDSSTMQKLFYSAEERMQKASMIVGKHEEHGKEAKSTMADSHNDAVTLEQEFTLKSQVYLLWGNILYEHSQVEFRLQLPSWKELLDAAISKFEVAGASSSDISIALEKHLSKSDAFLDVDLYQNDDKVQENEASHSSADFGSNDLVPVQSMTDLLNEGDERSPETERISGRLPHEEVQAMSEHKENERISGSGLVSNGVIPTALSPIDSMMDEESIQLTPDRDENIHLKQVDLEEGKMLLNVAAYAQVPYEGKLEVSKDIILENDVAAASSPVDSMMDEESIQLTHGRDENLHLKQVESEGKVLLHVAADAQVSSEGNTKLEVPKDTILENDVAAASSPVDSMMDEESIQLTHGRDENLHLKQVESEGKVLLHVAADAQVSSEGNTKLEVPKDTILENDVAAASSPVDSMMDEESIQLTHGRDENLHLKQVESEGEVLIHVAANAQVSSEVNTKLEVPKDTILESDIQTSSSPVGSMMDEESIKLTHGRDESLHLKREESEGNVLLHVATNAQVSSEGNTKLEVPKDTILENDIQTASSPLDSIMDEESVQMTHGRDENLHLKQVESEGKVLLHVAANAQVSSEENTKLEVPKDTILKNDIGTALSAVGSMMDEESIQLTHGRDENLHLKQVGSEGKVLLHEAANAQVLSEGNTKLEVPKDTILENDIQTASSPVESMMDEESVQMTHGRDENLHLKQVESEGKASLHVAANAQVSSEGNTKFKVPKDISSENYIQTASSVVASMVDEKSIQLTHNRVENVHLKQVESEGKVLLHVAANAHVSSEENTKLEVPKDTILKNDIQTASSPVESMMDEESIQLTHGRDENLHLKQVESEGKVLLHVAADAQVSSEGNTKLEVPKDTILENDIQTASSPLDSIMDEESVQMTHGRDENLHLKQVELEGKGLLHVAANAQVSSEENTELEVAKDTILKNDIGTALSAVGSMIDEESIQLTHGRDENLHLKQVESEGKASLHVAANAQVSSEGNTKFEVPKDISSENYIQTASSVVASMVDEKSIQLTHNRVENVHLKQVESEGKVLLHVAANAHVSSEENTKLEVPKDTILKNDNRTALLAVGSMMDEESIQSTHSRDANLHLKQVKSEGKVLLHVAANAQVSSEGNAKVEMPKDANFKNDK